MPRRCWPMPAAWEWRLDSAQSGVGAAVAFGISAASNTISNQVLAYLDDATVTAMGNVSVIATEDASIEALTIGGAVGVGSSVGASGVGVGAAGAGSGNTISDDTEAYISDNSVVTTTSGSISVLDSDSSTIMANAGGLGIGVGVGGNLGVGVSLGVAAAVNTVKNTVKAYIDSSQVASAAALTVSAHESDNIEALTIGGAVAVAKGNSGAGAVAAAGSDSTNSIADTISAYISNSTGVNSSSGGSDGICNRQFDRRGQWRRCWHCCGSWPGWRGRCGHCGHLRGLE